MDHTNGASLALGGGATTTGGAGEEGLSADHQLLCQIGNCLQLETVSPDSVDARRCFCVESCSNHPETRGHFEVTGRRSSLPPVGRGANLQGC